MSNKKKVVVKDAAPVQLDADEAALVACYRKAKKAAEGIKKKQEEPIFKEISADRQKLYKARNDLYEIIDSLDGDDDDLDKGW